MEIRGRWVRHWLGRWRSAVNLPLKKSERVTTGGKGRGEIGNEIGKVTGMVADAPSMDSLVKRYGDFMNGMWQLEKWRYCWWLVGFMWTKVQKSSISTSRKVI